MRHNRHENVFVNFLGLSSGVNILKWLLTFSALYPLAANLKLPL